MTATMNKSAQAASDDFDLIARAFVAEHELERDDEWKKIVDALVDESFGLFEPQRLVAPALDHLWVGA